MAISDIQNTNTIDKLHQLLSSMDMTFQDLTFMEELSPYLILDGHRTGVQGEHDMSYGYIEGAIFSMRFARILQELGAKKVTFLIHTLRNYKTMDRMSAIFDGVEQIAEKFIKTARESDIKLRYYGHDVHDGYALAKPVKLAEHFTMGCQSFELNYLTNYSEQWGVENQPELEDLPDINVVGRFTKGHYSGANIPGHTNEANFIYIQQASISENWSDDELVILALSLLKSYLSLKGFVGGKSYTPEEKEEIKHKREYEAHSDVFDLSIADKHTKQIMSFSPMGPISIKF